MPKFVLAPIEAPWGDYGAILYHGMSMQEDRLDGRLRLERTGPDIFPITFPINIVVTDQFRNQFAASGLSGARFHPVIKHRIVELNWHAWDLTGEEIPEMPESGEPEDYILTRPHSPKAAAAMPDLWEFVATENPDADIRYLPATHVVTLSTKAKVWFERNYGDFVWIQQRA